MNVYFIRMGKKGPIKIGVAKDIQRRMSELQTANPYELKLISSIPCKSENDAYRLEKKIHSIFKKQNIRGEWFQGNIRMNRIKDFDKEAEIVREYTDSKILAAIPANF